MNSAHRALLLLLPCAAALSASARARASEPTVHPTLAWAAAQVVPSPELTVGQGVHFGLRWQLTPVLYSFGIHRSRSPWRSFVVEPIVRQSGSIELAIHPELLMIGKHGAAELGFRAGLRSYFPVIQRGDYLSLSLGSCYAQIGAERSAGYEVGAYVLFGLLGVQVALFPGFERARYVTTLAVRIF